ncbi:MAG TPA: hypothetical protein VFQ98_03060 [Gallionella sp.]|nr:hypothetical protein [Gallionella sp.]
MQNAPRIMNHKNIRLRPLPRLTHCDIAPLESIFQADFVVNEQFLKESTKKSLAFILFIRIMRALPHLAALVHRFLTYLSRACKSRLSKKTHQGILGFPVSNDVLCAG